MLHLNPELVNVAAAEDGGYQAFRIPAIAGCVDDQVVATGPLALYPSATGAEVMA